MGRKIYLIYTEVSELETIGHKQLQRLPTKDEKGFVSYFINELEKKNPEIKYYQYLDKRKSKKKLEEKINEINNSDLENIGFITDKKDLYEFFNRKIHLTTFYEHFYNKDMNDLIIDKNMMTYNIVFDNLIFSKKEELNYESSIFLAEGLVHRLLISFTKYNRIFNINIKLLTKDTGYKSIKTFESLINLINSDIKIYIYYNILTSRLVIVLKRLCDFDLNQSSKRIGNEMSKYFGIKSASYKYSFNKKKFYTDLNNKNFRGYKIKSLLNNEERIRVEEQIKIYDKLKQHKIDKGIIRDIFKYKHFMLEKNNLPKQETNVFRGLNVGDIIPIPN